MDRETYPDQSLEQAAAGQLDTAIDLWFHDKDPASIHTLALAANGIVKTIARDRKLTLRSGVMEHLKTKSKRFQDAMRHPTNFFKHGNPKLKDGYHPRSVEIFVLDSINSYNQIFKRLTTNMVLFLAWTAIQDKMPKLMPKEIESMLIQHFSWDYLAGLTRPDFFAKVAPLLN